MKGCSIIAWILLLSISGPKASAQLSPLAERVLKELNLTPEQCKQEFITEKELPDIPGTSVMVIPKIAEENDVFFALDSYVLLVDSKTGKIQSSFFESHQTNSLQSDAMKLDQISIDTAPYMLKDGVRAFGIRVAYTGSSRANPYDYETISLLVREGKKLKTVLKRCVVQKYTGQWDTKCAGQFKTENSALSISKTATNGFRDIVVKTRVTNTKNIYNHGDCIEQKQSSATEKTLRFRKDHYE